MRTITCALCIVMSAALSMSAKNVTGTVIDETQQPVSFVNVVLIADSTFIDGKVTDDAGRFLFENADSTANKVKISMIGYEDLVLPIPADGNFNTLSLTPSSVMLGEVVVKANLPSTRIKGNAIVTNVENSVLATTGSANGMNRALHHLTVLEEAHNLLKRSSVEGSSESSNLLGKSVEMIANAIAEMRTYGEGFVIVDQAPGLLDMAAIRNTNTKIIMRLPDQSDRELVGKAANLNENQITELSKLPCGVAAIYQNEWIEPVLCKVNKYHIAQQSYQYERPKTGETENNIEKRIHIAELLSHGTKIDKEAERKEIRKQMMQLGLDASIQVMVIKMLENPPKVPRMTKLALIMNALFTSVTDAVKESSAESCDASEWTRSAENALYTLGITQIDDLVRRDIIQCAMTYYFIIERKDEDKLRKWQERGGLQ